MTDTGTDTEAGRLAAESIELLNSIRDGSWVEGQRTGGGLAALDATMRPIDELASANLGWLTTHVQPLQSVLDRMAGQAAVIQSYADAWERAANKIAEIREQLRRRAEAETSDWHGLAGDGYRGRARELTSALEVAANVAWGTGIFTKQQGEVIAAARLETNRLLTDLVRRLISYAHQAIAIEGGVTPNVVAQCTSMIDTYQGPISAIEQRLEQTMSSIQPPTIPSAPPYTTGQKIADGVGTFVGAAGPSGKISGMARAWGGIKSIFGKRGSAQRKREEDRAYDQRERERQRQQNADWQRYEREHYRGNDYTKGMEEIYGAPPKDGHTYVGHHNYVVKFGRRFEELGINTNDPAWGSWVRETDHQGFSRQLEQDWSSFFQNNPNATRSDAVAFARALGKKYGYNVPF
ncbi:MAG: WXG100 family type VII secretion target [Labedaea sp.]